jgi:hypothetical protein
MDWFVGESLRLFYDRDPPRGFDWAERIEISVLLEMAVLVLADFLDQNSSRG